MVHKTYMVTGGAGFIGSHICEELLKLDKKVICVDNLVAGNIENIRPLQSDRKFEFRYSDILQLKSRDFEGVDIVFHNAASKCNVCTLDPHLDLQVNAWGSQQIAENAIEAGVKKVVYGSTGSTNGGEPKSFYGASKLAAEAYLCALKEYHPEFRYTILRYYHVFGPRQDASDFGGVIPIFIMRNLLKKPLLIFGDGEQIRHFTSVKDVVRANFFAVERGEKKNQGKWGDFVDIEEPDNIVKTDCEDYEVLSDTRITINALAELVCKLMGVKPNIKYEPERPGDIKYFIARNSKLTSLGFKFTHKFEDYLKETIDWYKVKWKSLG